jgi:transposase
VNADRRLRAKDPRALSQERDLPAPRQGRRDRPGDSDRLVAAVGDRSSFKNGRQFAAWLGLVPKQRPSGGRARLFGISKRGDRYLRTLLIHGARSALGRVRDKQDPRSLWLGKMRQRRHPNIVAVALANKNARIAWSLLTSDSVYDVKLSVRAA